MSPLGLRDRNQSRSDGDGDSLGCSYLQKLQRMFWIPNIGSPGTRVNGGSAFTPSIVPVLLAAQAAFARGLVAVVCFEVAFEAQNLVGDGQVWARLLIRGNVSIACGEALVPPRRYLCISYGEGSRRRKVIGVRARNLCTLQANR